MFKKYKFLIVSISIYLIVVGTVSVLRHYQFQTQAWDMGIFEQTMWNTANGRVMQNSLEEVSNHLGVHMSPFLFLLIPFYIFWQSPYFLIIIQTMAIAFGAIPLYFFAKEKLPNSGLTKAIIVSYLLHPSLLGVNLFDFHAVSFFIPLVLSAFYFFEKKRYFWTSFFMVLAASTKEDAAVVSIFIVFYWLLISLFKFENKKIIRRKINKQSKKVLSLLIFLILYFIISVKLVMPALGGGLVRIDRYAHFGSTIGEVLKNVFLNPALLFSTVFTYAKIKYVFFLLLPVIFLSLRSFSFIFLVLPGVAENILTNYNPQFSGLYQYDAVILPGLYISTIYGLVFLLNKIKKERAVACVMIALSLISFGYFLFYNPLFASVLNTTDLFVGNKNRAVYDKVVKMIPKEGSVAAPTVMVPHLTHREYIRMIGTEDFFTDIVIIDRFDKYGFNSDEQFQAYFDSKINSQFYNMTVVDDQLVVLTKKNIMLKH
ncbi:MAG: DUF2079 domain-containing protein [bacterium]|nr:DUF2079 domain-containing protein [bacterium]